MMLGHKAVPYLGGTGMLKRKNNKMLITQIMSKIFHLSSVFINDQEGGRWMIL
jgi:hypothetical protein